MAADLCTQSKGGTTGQTTLSLYVDLVKVVPITRLAILRGKGVTS